LEENSKKEDQLKGLIGGSLNVLFEKEVIVFRSLTFSHHHHQPTDVNGNDKQEFIKFYCPLLGCNTLLSNYSELDYHLCMTVKQYNYIIQNVQI
jgi:hypothetical protein